MSLSSAESILLKDTVFKFSVHFQEHVLLSNDTSTPASTSSSQVNLSRTDTHQTSTHDIFDLPKTHGTYFDVVVEGILQSSFFTGEDEAEAEDEDAFVDDDGESVAASITNRGTISSTTSGKLGKLRGTGHPGTTKQKRGV